MGVLQHNRGKSRHWRMGSKTSFVTHHVTSRPSIDALRKVHSITSSATASTLGGMVILIAFHIIALWLPSRM